MSTEADKSKTARGRTVASKSTASSAGKSRRTPSASSTVSSKSSSVSRSSSVKAGNSASTSTSRTPSQVGFKVTKLSSTTVKLESSWTPKPPSASASTSAPAEPATRPTDSLQAASQAYPWTYMSSTLDAYFKDAEVAALNDLDTHAKEVAGQESEIADQRIRLDAERTIAFADELSSDPFAKEAPAIMKLFHSNGDSCSHIETAALKLASQDTPDFEAEEPLKPYKDMLRELEELHNEATSIQESITKLTEDTTQSDVDGDSAKANTETDTASARTQVLNVFSACLPVLRARIANISLAQELIDSALENVSLGLRMQSMGIAD